MSISIYGAGTLGSRVLAGSHGPKKAITRTPDRHDTLRALGAEPTTAWVLPDRDTDVVLALPGSSNQLEAVRRLAHTRPRRAVLVSTTGYHAPYEGRVEADSPPGRSERAQLAATTEAAFRDWMGERGVIVRLGGLYTRERGPAAYYAREDRIRPAPADAPLPLVHYDDAATLVLRALQGPCAPCVLGVVEVVDRATFYTAVAAHLGRPTPTFAPATGRAVTFDLQSCRELLPEPAHPDFRAHLPVPG